jgi:hypothetical protein
MSEWTLFSDKLPEVGKAITLTWSYNGIPEDDNIGSDFIWTGEVDWSLEFVPYRWRYLDL